MDTLLRGGLGSMRRTTIVIGKRLMDKDSPIQIGMTVSQMVAPVVRDCLWRMGNVVLTFTLMVHGMMPHVRIHTPISANEHFPKVVIIVNLIQQIVT
jgi:hypothetical protein